MSGATTGNGPCRRTYHLTRVQGLDKSPYIPVRRTQSLPLYLRLFQVSLTPLLCRCYGTDVLLQDYHRFTVLALCGPCRDRWRCLAIAWWVQEYGRRLDENVKVDMGREVRSHLAFLHVLILSELLTSAEVLGQASPLIDESEHYDWDTVRWMDSKTDSRE